MSQLIYSHGGSQWTSILGIICLLGLFCLCSAILIRYRERITGLKPHRQSMKVLEKLSLEPRRSLYIVKVGAETLLVGTGENGVRILKTMPESDNSARDIR